MRIVFLFIFIAISLQAEAQYFQTALGLNGNALKIELHNIIKGHSAQVWPLWTHFQTTDDKPSGHVWDMYSDVPSGSPPYNYTFSNTCGQYSSEGDCFNHEHLWPKTYFNGNVMPMRTDLHHLVPTDGYVNNKRGSFPFGQVNSVSWTSNNGSKTGSSSTYAGYNLDVFEPIDDYKGDIARSMLYMNIRYTTEDAAWNNWIMANGAELTADALALFLQWHQLDPVSQKELDRNDRVYQIQGNRNPFVDYPEFAECIWGTSDCTALTVEDLKAKDVLFWPNPATTQIQFEKERAYKIFSVTGQILKEGKAQNIDLSFFTKGLYFIQMNSVNKKQKLIVQ